LDATLIVETATVFAGLAIIAEPATKAYLAVARDARSAAAARRDRKQEAPSDALTALLRESLHQAAATVGTPPRPSITRYSAGPAAGDSPAGPADANLTMSAAERAERRSAVLAARAAGLTWAQIGAELGMTSQTVRGVARRSAAGQNGAGV